MMLDREIELKNIPNINVVVAAAQDWAKGIQDGIQIQCGSEQEISTISTDTEHFNYEFAELIEKLSSNCDCIAVFSDGLVKQAQEVMRLYADRGQILLSEDVSLPMLLNFIVCENEQDTELRMDRSMAFAREQCLYLNPIVNSMLGVDEFETEGERKCSDDK